jgi:hypothetical protein
MSIQLQASTGKNIVKHPSAAIRYEFKAYSEKKLAEIVVITTQRSLASPMLIMNDLMI